VSRRREAVDPVYRLAATQIAKLGDLKWSECCAVDKNAEPTNRFPRRTTTFWTRFLQNRNRLSSVSSGSVKSQEIVMASAQLRHRISRLAFTAASALVISCSAGAAFASQGHGGGPGTAGGFTQLAMAIIVYGLSAVIISAGLIGAVRRH
jgi:hypothetical protein